MTVEEIARGESKNVEFKVMLPKDSEKYIKSIIAFANTQGGQLIIGIDDRTREVVGVDADILFQTMDSISNTVSDACTPQIVPNVEPQTVDGKTVIVVTVAPGPNRPYYLKSKGRDAGTFIRVAGTSRPAHPEKIKELEMEGARISWDELACVGYQVTEEAVKKLCDDIMEYRQRAGLPKREVTEAQLVNWKLLRKTDGSHAASNAFVLLTSDYFPFSRTQCAVFKGTERVIFLDKREFSGPLYQQIEEATNFVLRNIRLGATIEGLLRRESYELPVEAIREMIINAHCHRCQTDESCVQVAVYDDRLEVTSPGGLYNGLTYEDALNGHSKLRNRAIANVFNQMGLIEAWGTGIKRMIQLAAAYGLPSPEIQAFDSMFRVNLYRSNSLLMDGESSAKFGENDEKVEKGSVKFGEKDDEAGESSVKLRPKFDDEGLNETQKEILAMIRENSKVSAVRIAKKIEISTRAVEKNIKELREKGILKRQGTARGGYWKVVDKSS